MKGGPAARAIASWQAGGLIPRDDVLSVEEPLEIRLNGEPVSITMRTPGHDAELAAGFLHGEGLLPDLASLAALSPVVGIADAPQNTIDVATVAPVDTERLRRSFYATSSCGVCGKSSLKALETLAPPITSALRVSAATLLGLPARLATAQATFAATGSLHATGLFDAEGGLLMAFEDVGRHNAVDKVVGRCLLNGTLPLHDTIMLVSGRTSFEILQKAVMAGIPIVCAISGPSTLAVDLATRFGVTLVGFLRGERFNVYSHPERIEA